LLQLLPAVYLYRPRLPKKSPLANKQGDFSNYSKTWEAAIRSGTLNCRSGPGTNYRILNSFKRGERIISHNELEGNTIQYDKQNKPWLRVKYQYEGTSAPACFVRANLQFIRPLVSGCGQWDPILQICLCGSREWDSLNQTCVAE
jgi:hypothetical protein